MPRKKLNRKCKFWWCDDNHFALGWCQRHYTFHNRYGQPLSPIQPGIIRLHEKVNELCNLLSALRPMIDKDTYGELLEIIDNQLEECQDRGEAHK